MFRFFSSLQFVVLLLIFAMLLIVIGTVVEVQEGLAVAKREVFQSFFIWMRWPSFSIPILPGGYTVGGALAVSLMVSLPFLIKKNLCLSLIHLGLLFLILGEALVTLFTTESLLTLKEKEARNYSEVMETKEPFVLPATIRLVSFSQRNHVGTTIPKWFSSTVEFLDERGEVVRLGEVSMNHPVSVGLDTFYQYSQNPHDRSTTLLVVHNPFYLTPYVACSMIFLGLLLYFLSQWTKRGGEGA